MDRSRIRLIALAIAAAVVLVAVATHFLLPGFLESQVEERLEARGGRADVTLKAVPAIRLLAGHGDRIEIHGSGLDYDFAEPESAFEKLDKFDEVEIELRNTTAGPFEVEGFDLTRSGSDSPYVISIDASTEAQELAEAAGEGLGGGLGKIIGGLAGGAIPFSTVDVPIRVDGEFESDGGRVRMVDGGGTVAGLPAGPVIELVTNAVLSRL